MTFPLTKKEFEEKLLKRFLNEDFEITVGNGDGTYDTFVLSPEIKQEFLEHEQKSEIDGEYYLAELQYDYHGKDQSIDEYLGGFLADIVRHCGTYIYMKNNPRETLKESKYPMSFEEFQEKVIKFFKEANTREEDREWLEWFLNKDSPEFMKTAYEEACDDYDDAVNGENGVTPDKIFTDYYIKSNPVRVLEMF